MNAAETNRAIARSDLAQALRDPQMTGKNLLVFKRSLEIAEAELEIQTARAADAAELRAEQAKAQAEADALAAAEARVAEREAAQVQAGVVADAIETARTELAKLLNMPGVHPAGLEIVVLKTNRTYSDPVARCVCHDLPAVVGLPSEADAQRRAALSSQAEAHKVGTADILRMAASVQRGAQSRETLTAVRLPQRGTRIVGTRAVIEV